jgi:hypothetical protein
MEKELFIAGSIEVSIGALLLCLISIAKDSLLAIWVYTMQFSEIESTFHVQFTLPGIISISLIVIGLGQIVYGCFHKQKT